MSEYDSLLDRFVEAGVAITPGANDLIESISNEIESLCAKLDIAMKALKSIEWITKYSDGSKDHCKIDRSLVEQILIPRKN